MGTGWLIGRLVRRVRGAYLSRGCYEYMEESAIAVSEPHEDHGPRRCFHRGSRLRNCHFFLGKTTSYGFGADPAVIRW